MVGRHVRQAFDPVAVFVALLAASFRDVDLSWDRSVLESMHSAVGNALLFGEGRIRKARAKALRALAPCGPYPSATYESC